MITHLSFLFFDLLAWLGVPYPDLSSDSVRSVTGGDENDPSFDPDG